MAMLRPGTIMKLLDKMKNDNEFNGNCRSSILQVSDIVPIDLDQNTLWPNNGFYIKLCDSVNSIYVNLPFEQGEIILSNQIRLGQYVRIEKFEPGSPVPIVRTIQPIPGRRLLMDFTDKSNVLESQISKVPCRRKLWAPDENSLDLLNFKISDSVERNSLPASLPATSTRNSQSLISEGIRFSRSLSHSAVGRCFPPSSKSPSLLLA